MRKLYSTPPSDERSEDKDYQKSIWAPIEEFELGKAILVVVISILVIGIFIIHVSILLLITLIIVSVLITRFIVLDAQKNAFERYWAHWNDKGRKK